MATVKTRPVFYQFYNCTRISRTIPSGKRRGDEIIRSIRTRALKRLETESIKNIAGINASRTSGCSKTPTETMVIEQVGLYVAYRPRRRLYVRIIGWTKHFSSASFLPLLHPLPPFVSSSSLLLPSFPFPHLPLPSQFPPSPPSPSLFNGSPAGYKTRKNC